MDEYIMIPEAQLMESPTNPRKHFPLPTLLELSENIKAVGIIENLVVRATDKTTDKILYEVICGARRVRAGRMAGLTEFPCRVVTLSDEEVLDIQIAENMQREAVDPMDEAEVFQMLMQKKHMTLEEIAARFGKTQDYIFGRMRLTSLCEEAKTFLEDKTLPVTAAIKLSTLSHKQQRDAIRRIIVDVTIDGTMRKMFTGLKDLRVFVEQNIILPLNTADFNITDEKLIPECGSCISCAKRTGNSLFKEMVDSDKCLDSDCYKNKHLQYYRNLHQILSKQFNREVVYAARFYKADIEYKDLGEVIALTDYDKITEKEALKKNVNGKLAVFIGPDRMRDQVEHVEYGWIQVAKKAEKEVEASKPDVPFVIDDKARERQKLEDMKQLFYKKNLFDQFREIKQKGIPSFIVRHLIAHLWNQHMFPDNYILDIVTRYNLSIKAQLLSGSWQDIVIDKEYQFDGSHVSIDFVEIYDSIGSLSIKQMDSLLNELMFIIRLQDDEEEPFVKFFELDKDDAMKQARAQVKSYKSKATEVKQ